jgi:hypothetical protein
VRDFVEQHSSFPVHLIWVLLKRLARSQVIDQGSKQRLAIQEERIAHDDSVVFELLTVCEGISANLFNFIGTGNLIQPVCLVDILAAYANLSVWSIGVKVRDISVNHCTTKIS